MKRLANAPASPRPLKKARTSGSGSLSIDEAGADSWEDSTAFDAEPDVRVISDDGSAELKSPQDIRVRSSPSTDEAVEATKPGTAIKVANSNMPVISNDGSAELQGPHSAPISGTEGDSEPALIYSQHLHPLPIPTSGASRKSLEMRHLRAPSNQILTMQSTSTNQAASSTKP